MTKINVTLAHNIKAIRKAWRMEQKEFAQYFGVNRAVVSNWENYKNYPSIEVFLDIMVASGVGAWQLYHVQLDPNDLARTPTNGLLKNDSNKGGPSSEPGTPTKDVDTQLIDMEARLNRLEEAVFKK